MSDVCAAYRPENHYEVDPGEDSTYSCMRSRWTAWLVYICSVTKMTATNVPVNRWLSLFRLDMHDSSLLHRKMNMPSDNNDHSTRDMWKKSESLVLPLPNKLKSVQRAVAKLLVAVPLYTVVSTVRSTRWCLIRGLVSFSILMLCTYRVMNRALDYSLKLNVRISGIKTCSQTLQQCA